MNIVIPISILVFVLLSGCNVSIEDDAVTVTGLPPIIDSLQTSYLSATTVTVTFNTNENATSEINYADSNYYIANSAYNLTEQVAGYTTAHNITLSNLSPSTTYYYEIVTQDVDSNTTTLGSQSFTTLAPDSATLVISNPTPAQSSVLPAGTTSAVFGVTTNKLADCRYSALASTAFDNMSNVFSSTGMSVHSSTLNGLVSGNTYTYYVRCRDALDNATTSDFPITFSIASGNVTNRPPVLDLIQDIVVTEGDTVTFSPTATDPDIGDSLTYTYSGWMTSSTYTTQSGDAGNHSVTVTVDDGNGGTDSQSVSVQVLATTADITPPLRSSGKPTGTLALGTTETILSLSTDEDSTCKYSDTANTDYAAMPNDFMITGGTTHSTLVSGLANDTTYAYYFRCQDTSGNANNDDHRIRFRVAAETKSFMQAIQDGEAAPVMINGQAWTFRTPPPPPSERTVRTDHPRLVLTPDNLPGIRQKLNDPVYTSLMTAITYRADAGGMLENAFLYQISGDSTRGEAAKQALLNYTGSYGKSIMRGHDSMSDKLGPVLVFDWIWDLLNASEKAQIFANVKDNFNYDHHIVDPIIQANNNGPKTYPWYWNDVYKGFPELYLPALAFAIANEGIDDAWADEVISWAYDEDEPKVLGPYGLNRGSGFLDVLMSVSLETGGTSQLGVDYFGYWVEVVHAVSFWETATGQSIWDRVPLLTQNPRAMLTGRDGVSTPDGVIAGKIGLDPNYRTTSALEYITGVAQGDTAALAKYAVEFYDQSNFNEVYRAILGDMRTTAKSPAELNLPTADYVRGDHTFYSKESWADDAVSLYVRSPYINVGRYVGNEGVFALYKGKTPISPRAKNGKTQPHAGVQSGIWIYDPTATDAKKRPLQNEGTFWAPIIPRSFDAWTTVSNGQYFEKGPDTVEVTADYRAISMEYGDRYLDFVVGRVQRTIIHIPDGTRNFIVVYDYIDDTSDLKTAWSMRLMDAPTINGSTFSTPGTFNATVVSPAGHTLEWLGGEGLEFASPSPERDWYMKLQTHAVPGYSVDYPDYIHKFGLGNLFIQPAGLKDSSIGPFPAQTEYLVVIEVSTGVPVPVTRISDREVSFDQWRVSFNPDGSYQVTRQ